MRKTLLTYLFILAGTLVFAQEGNFYITNFTPSAYGANDQNWSITQDSLGRVFVANLSGVMMYDGKYWKIIQLDDDKEAISLAKAKNGTIYVGGGGDFGYIAFNDSGKVKYNSLSKTLPEKEKEFGNVWAIHVIGKDIFFCANEKIFWYQDDKFQKSFTPTGEKFHTFFNVGNILLVREQGVGLQFFKDGALHKILGTGELADVRVYAALPVGDNLYWICSRNGLYVLYFNINQPEISNLAKVNSPIDKWLIENNIYCGAKINDDLYALGSLKKGVILIDKKFNIHNSINYEKGLQDDAVKYIYRDYSGNIWLAINKGISYAEINTPLTHWAKTNGIQGVIESVAKYKGLPYIATDKGIQKLNTKTNSFEATGITDEGWALQTYNDVLLAGTNVSLSEIDEKGSKQLMEAPDGVFYIFANPNKKEQLFLAGRTSLTVANYKNHSIQVTKVYEGAGGIRSAVAAKDGQLVFGSIESALYVIDPKYPDSLITYTEKEGLPSLSEIYVFPYNDDVLFCTGVSGIYTYKKNNPNLFIKDAKYNIPTVRKTQITKAAQVGQDIWLASNYTAENSTRVDELSTLKQVGGKFEHDSKLLKRIRDLSPKCFLVEHDAVFIGTNDGLIEYSTKPVSQNFQFNTLISKITQKIDTIPFVQNLSASFKFPEPEFKYKNNFINFFPAATDYYDKNEIEFSYYLEGKEDSYGEWTKIKNISYDNLHEGHYIFHLKSKNILGIEGKPISFGFTILPPWYRTYWAYALYFFGSVGLIWFIVQFNIKRLKEQNIKLEKIIAERTKEVELQKEEIEHKNQEITDSINYAKRIQQAILPPIPDIKRAWTNSFVFFQPKDIVSGDFYWFSKVNDNEMLIACCDCTGHGVPGGFMSMICSDKLNDAVKITKDPAEILFHVNNNVKLALRQHETADENVNKDGMEIALVKINFAQKKIWYAGANRPLWLLKTTASEIEEVKPTKASIASFTAVNFNYQAHEIQLDKGDLVYMTSDGYPDQFGGQDGKKFMTKNFKKLILSIKDLSIPEQETTLKNIINQWMSGYEQVDDLLVIGFRI
ncbi:MAG: SpoIIE family protein phosphatase [Bacteroidia bacterium]